MNVLNSIEVNYVLNRFPNDIINNIKLHYYALIIQQFYRANRYKFNRTKRFRTGDRVLFRHNNKYKFGTINSCIQIKRGNGSNGSNASNASNASIIYNIESLEYINKQTHKNLSNNFISLYKNTCIYTTKIYRIVENSVYKLINWKHKIKISYNYDFYNCARIKYYFKTKFIKNKNSFKSSYILNSLNHLNENEQIDFFYSLY